jgi:hypothetical protein
MQNSDATRRGNAFCRPGQASARERDPGPITTGLGGYEDWERVFAWRNDSGLWLWVPAFAGTTSLFDM